jgi:3-phosphoshikimate 1-carboxyvinyltransferase
MRIKVYPSSLSGILEVPSSKSHFQRILAASLLSNDKSIINYHTISNDDKAVLNVIQDLGARVEIGEKQIIINGGLSEHPGVVNCGESGLCLRMFTPILALLNHKVIINGEGSLLNRPQQFMQQALSELGVELKSSMGLLPLSVKGPLQAGNIRIDGSFSSQFLTGLLMALPLCDSDSSIHVENLVSRPYIDLTLKTLDSFGIRIVNKEYQQFMIPGKQRYSGGEFTVEGDWSSASNLIIGALSSGEVTLQNLDQESTQADRRLMNLLNSMEVRLKASSQEVMIFKSEVSAFTFNASECPDLFPPLVSFAVLSRKKCEINGVKRLKHKESDRAQSLIREFAKLGIAISVNDDLLTIEGTRANGGTVHSHNDHRIAMALAITALSATEAVVIEGAECVKKSYPGFWNDLQKLGANIEFYHPED